jgi:hypothetical protein
MNNLQKAKMLESDYCSQIQKLIKIAGSQNQLSIFLYGNENTLQSKLSRAKNSTPWKLMTYCQVLLDYDLVKKKSRGNAV